MGASVGLGVEVAEVVTVGGGVGVEVAVVVTVDGVGGELGQYI